MTISTQEYANLSLHAYQTPKIDPNESKRRGKTVYQDIKLDGITYTPCPPSIPQSVHLNQFQNRHSRPSSLRPSLFSMERQYTLEICYLSAYEGSPRHLTVLPNGPTRSICTLRRSAVSAMMNVPIKKPPEGGSVIIWVLNLS